MSHVELEYALQCENPPQGIEKTHPMKKGGSMVAN